MIRALVIVAVAGFLTSVACITAAIAIGGPDAIARSAWSWDWSEDWGEHRGWGPHHFGFWRREAREAGPQANRDFPWSGDRLEVNAPAQIDYVQASGPAKLTISGPRAALDRVRVEAGRISLLPGPGGWNELHVTLSAPDVSRFELNGADRLNITGYNQDKLALSASGHAEIRAAGQAHSVTLSLSGAGAADLAELKTARADIDISGAGAATVAPTDWARVQISGMGDVNLLTRPKQLESHVSGAGRVRLPGEDSATSGEDDGDARGPARPT
jgi:hypothetical protein